MGRFMRVMRVIRIVSLVVTVALWGWIGYMRWIYTPPPPVACITGSPLRPLPCYPEFPRSFIQLPRRLSVLGGALPV